MAKPSQYLPKTAAQNVVDHDHGRPRRMSTDQDYDAIVVPTENHHEDLGSEVQIESTSQELLEARVKELEALLDQSEAKNAELEAKNVQLQEEIDKHNKTLFSVFNEDEIQRLKNKKSKKKFSNKTIKKALKLYYTCSRSGYELLLSLGHPLPCVRTLQLHMKKVPFEPGTLHSIITKLKSKVQAMHPKERYCGIVMDEVFLQAKREYDSSKGSFVGHPTVNAPPKTMERRKANGEHPMERLASHGLAVMLVGIGTRWKQLAGVHLTDSSFDAKFVKDWIEDLIKQLQSIGLKVYSLTLDMGPSNKAL